MAKITSFREPGPRYPVLRFVSGLCNGLGLLMLVLSGLLLAAGSINLALGTVGPMNGPVFAWIALLWALGLFASGIHLIVVGSLIRLAIHVEENTRATAQALDQMRLAGGAKPEVDARSIFLS